MKPYLDEIITGDCRELSKQIPDKSVDLIFTDPPYLTKYLHLYNWLSDEGCRVLKDDGFMLAYVGVYHKHDVLNRIAKNFDYFWDFCLVNVNASPIIWDRKVISRHKSIIAFRKIGARCKPNTNVLSFWVGSGEDKRFHTWGQDESSARYFIQCFSKRGDLVYDPFCGGGTTPYVCTVLDRRFVSFETDEESANKSRGRLMNVQKMIGLLEVDQSEMNLELATK